MATSKATVPIGKIQIESASDLKILMDALNSSPSWLSKRFIMTELLGWPEEKIKLNVDLRTEEHTSEKVGDRIGSYR